MEFVSNLRDCSCNDGLQNDVSNLQVLSEIRKAYKVKGYREGAEKDTEDDEGLFDAGGILDLILPSMTGSSIRGLLRISNSISALFGLRQRSSSDGRGFPSVPVYIGDKGIRLVARTKLLTVG